MFRLCILSARFPCKMDFGMATCRSPLGSEDVEWEMHMNLIELILTVCSLAQPTSCQDQHLQFLDQGSLMQCMFQAPTYIAQWTGEHPGRQVVKWRCSYPYADGEPT
jgi:hypothetical protein